MIWSYEAVMKKLGDEAQVTAGGIIVLATVVGEDGVTRNKHIKVGYFDEVTFHVTKEGQEYLEPTVEDAVIVSETKKVKGRKKPELAAPVEPEPEVDDELDFPE
jgi:hypothetical protein